MRPALFIIATHFLTIPAAFAVNECECRQATTVPLVEQVSTFHAVQNIATPPGAGTARGSTSACPALPVQMRMTATQAVPRAMVPPGPLAAVACPGSSEALRSESLQWLLTQSVISTPFDPTRDSINFRNYQAGDANEAVGAQYLRDQRINPFGTMGLAHCTTFARLTRVFHDRVQFSAPQRYRRPPEEYRDLIRSMLRFDSTIPPEIGPHRIPLRGYANLTEFTSDPAIERIFAQEFGDALADYLQSAGRTGWGPLDNVSAQSRTPEEDRAGLRSILENLRRGRLTTTYLITTATGENHAVLIYGAERRGAQMDLLIYDSNDPAHESRLTINLCTGLGVSGTGRTNFRLHPLWRYREN